MRFEPFQCSASDRAHRLDMLRWRFHKWDLYVGGRCTVAPGALVLEAHEHEAVVAATERVARATLEARRRLRREHAAALGIPPEVAELAAASGPGPSLCRIDWFLTPDGWMASECNDDVPGGFNEAIGLPLLFGDLLRGGLDVAGDLPDALVDFVGGAGDLPVALLYATAYAEDQQVIEFLADLLALHGIETEAGSPAGVTADPDGVHVGDTQVGRLFRFFPTEWFPTLPNAAAWRGAEAWGAHVVNPFSAAWTQSKATFAWMQQEGAPPACRAANTHLPGTWLLDAEHAARALEDPDGFVLKPAFGRMGEGVTLGDRVTREEWRKRVTGALRAQRRRPFVLQERFRSLPVVVDEGRSHTVCVGAYAVDGRFAGYYGRSSPKEVTNFAATNVLVAVESV